MVNDHCGVDGGNPSQALLVVVPWLFAHCGVGDLFVVERLCKPLCDVIVGDPLLWKKINIVHPFCTNITNDILIKLKNRAQAHLYSLSLFH